MKTLNQYIKESILDDEEDIINSAPEVLIKEFILKNYDVKESYLKIKKSSNKYIVDCSGGVVIKNKKITQLTNDLFEWGEVEDFNCGCCDSLTSLKGSPEEVEHNFNCYNCKSLTSLQGAPEKVGGWFDCSGCTSLTSLEGAPKEVCGGFICSDCTSLKLLNGAPKEVGGWFDCSRCNSLTSLQGAPKKVGGWFDCRNCKIRFTKEDVEKESKVKGEIQV